MLLQHLRCSIYADFNILICVCVFVCVRAQVCVLWGVEPQGLAHANQIHYHSALSVEFWNEHSKKKNYLGHILIVCELHFWLRKITSSFNFNFKRPLSHYFSKSPAEGKKQWLVLIAWWGRAATGTEWLSSCYEPLHRGTILCLLLYASVSLVSEADNQHQH